MVGELMQVYGQVPPRKKAHVRWHVFPTFSTTNRPKRLRDTA